MSESFNIQDDEAGIEESTVIAARKNFSSGDYDGALKLYNGLLSMSANSQLYFETAMCYYKLNLDNEAIDYFKKSISLGLKSPLAYSYLGNIYYRLKDTKEAIKYWHISRFTGPEDEAVCLNLAVAYYSKNMMFEAMSLYENYLKYSKDKTTEGYKTIQKNINKCFSIANDYNIKGEKAQFARDFTTARTCFVYAVKNYPILYEPNLNLGKLYYEAGNYENSLVFLKQAYRINSTDKQLLLLIGDCYENLAQYGYAYCYYKRYLDKSISNQSDYLAGTKKISRVKLLITDSIKELHIEKAKSYEDSGEYYNALEEYENSSILMPERENEIKESLTIMRKYINPEADLINMYIKKGIEQRDIRNYPEANKYFTRVMTLSNPNSTEYKSAKSKIINV